MLENSSKVEYSSLESVVDLEWEDALLFPIDLIRVDFRDLLVLRSRARIISGEESAEDLCRTAQS